MRTRPRPRPRHTLNLAPLLHLCPECGHTLWFAYDNFRTSTTWDGVVRLSLHLHRCVNPSCARFPKP
jgi:hypothetical protein